MATMAWSKSPADILRGPSHLIGVSVCAAARRLPPCATCRQTRRDRGDDSLLDQAFGLCWRRRRSEDNHLTSKYDK